MDKKSTKNEALPKDWCRVSLREIASVKTGPFGAQLHQHDYVKSDGTPIVTVEHLSENGLMHENLPLVADHDKERLSQFHVKEGDILFSRVGSVDRSSLVSKKEDGWLFSGRLLRVRPDNNIIDSRYLRYFFSTEKFKHHMRSIAVGGTMPSLNTAILSNVKVSYPGRTLQQKIAELMNEWDTAIEKTKLLIADKEKLFRWIVVSLINKASHPEREVSDFTIEISIRNRNNVIDRVLSVTNHSGFILQEDQFERRVASANLSNYKIVNRGEYAYNPSRINIGSIARLDNWEIGALSPMYIVFKLDETKINSDYFLYWLSSYEAKQRINNSTQGSVRETVRFGDLGAMPIPLPSMEKQRKIASKLNAIKHEIALLKQITEKHRAQKRGVMQKLLNGEWTTEA